MQSVIVLQVKNQSGSLERVLRVMRHRGFELVNMKVDDVSSGTVFSVILQVQSERPLPLLTKQLNKLVDVILVKDDNALVVEHSLKPMSLGGVGYAQPA